jgi:metal-responsive CopG/Arc/MetJ family transcriptional regulator
MTIHRAHVLLPEDLVREIDAIVGPRGRSAFLVETARNEVRRQKLLQFLESKEPVTNHASDSTEKASEWVRRLRRQSESRIQNSSHRPKRHKVGKSR